MHQIQTAAGSPAKTIDPLATAHAAPDEVDDNSPDRDLDPKELEEIGNMPYQEVLEADPEIRKRWFKQLQVSHRELVRVVTDVMELMDPDNDVKLISLIGMTGIGKTTLASELHRILQLRYTISAQRSEQPVIYVSAPANGERSMSWKALYRRILHAGQAPDIDHMRNVRIDSGRLQGTRGATSSVAGMREDVEAMLKERKVRALIIDEALHLLRFNDYSAIMDTLKSLADIEHTKLILIGTHQIAELMTQYGQVIRRSEVVHYQRYRMSSKPGKALNADEQEYVKQLQKFQQFWPSRVRPNLEQNWQPLMSASLGSIGITKTILQQLLVLQLNSPDEQLLPAHLRKAIKAPDNLIKIEKETVAGEAKLQGACYGDGELIGDWAPLVQACPADVGASGRVATSEVRHG
jgi:energy-coupling factor transporter ATP-binding protein EcfA2